MCESFPVTSSSRLQPLIDFSTSDSCPPGMLRRLTAPPAEKRCRFKPSDNHTLKRPFQYSWRAASLMLGGELRREWEWAGVRWAGDTQC